MLNKLRTWLWCLKHIHFPPNILHTHPFWGEGARETGFRNFVTDEHWWTAHGRCPLPYKGLTCLVAWSLCPSNLCPQGVFPPSLVNPLYVDLSSENHNEKKKKNRSYTVTSPRDTKDILPLTWKWTKKQKHWQTYSCQSKWKGLHFIPKLPSLPRSRKTGRGACQVMRLTVF